MLFVPEVVMLRMNLMDFSWCLSMSRLGCGLKIRDNIVRLDTLGKSKCIDVESFVK